MAETIEVKVPDIGDFDDVDVVEVLVAPGDAVEVEQGLITLESDKASMEVPSPEAGVVRELKVEVGSKVAEGDVIAVLERTGDAETGEEAAEERDGDEPVDEADGAGPGDESEAQTEKREPRRDQAERPSAAAVQGSEPAVDLSTEVLVLGSGPGGYTAAFRAADLGKRVTLVERYPSLGGVCLNVGCIPSKALLHVAKVIEDAAYLGGHGVGFGTPEIDLDKLRAWKDTVVGRLTGGVASMAGRREIEVIEGTGRFVSPHRLAVDSGESTRTIGFEHAIIAVGSEAIKLPGLPAGDPRLMDSTSALELAEVPDRLLVVGGGIIGLEMATFYRALGSKITVVELLDGLMPGADRDIVRRFQRYVEKRYEAIYLETKVTAIEAGEDGLRVRFEGEKAPDSELFDRVLVAVGRRPNGGRIGAEAAGVEVDERGFIPVDRQMRTNVEHVFAIGDVVGQPMLAHKASHEAKVAAEVIAGHRRAFDARVIPSVAYTDPEVAWVGVTEVEAKERGLSYGKGLFPWSASGRSLALGREEGMTKLLFDEETKRVIGAAIVGPNAGDLIAEVGLAIEMGCEAADLGLTVHPHPTLSETVAFAAEVYEGTVTDLPPARKRKRRAG